MRTNNYAIRRFGRLANLIETTVTECEPNLWLSSEPFEAERLHEDGINIVFALRDAIEVLQPKGGAI
jgi:hypothetical protein